MRRIALLSLTLMTGGCEYSTWWNPPFTAGYNPNTPVTSSVNMSRVRGEGVAVTPLVTEPGDIWPGPLPPPRSLQDLQRQTAPFGGMSGTPAGGVPGGRVPRGSVPGGSVPGGGANNPLLAPLPGGSSTQPARGGLYPVPPPGSSRPSTVPPEDRRIIVPNGNGTSTVIHPDGRIETIPTPR